MNPTYVLAAVDLVAVLVLALAVYYPRHRRADLVTAFVAVNVGVLAVTIVLASSAATVGLGLGLFGVLSIIRLRSDELGQHEIAYYFAMLALGLLGGLAGSTPWLALTAEPDSRLATERTPTLIPTKATTRSRRR